MKIKSLTLRNFRSFGPEPTTIELAELTGFVGTNGCGKSTVLQALSRLFGTTNFERTLQQGDFHVPRDKTADEASPIDLVIEARLEFEELDGDGAPGDAVPACFREMIVEEPAATPYCRVRLEGTWKSGNLPEGDLSQELWWIKTPGDDVRPGDKQRMHPSNRSLIHVHYIPAARDPLKQIRQAAGTVMHRLFRALNWSDGIKTSFTKSTDELADSFRGEPGVTIIREAISKLWRHLHPMSVYSEVHLRPLSNRFEDFQAQIETIFGPAPEGNYHGSERLSDGLKSLFYLALIGSVFDIERETPTDVVPASDDGALHGISRERLNPPALTVLAVEEPENHLAPHYLGRIMKLLARMAASESGQVLLTSHSASIMARIEPESVRYLRLDMETQTTQVRPIELPPDETEARKFVREAVRAYPEIYFARLVVLGEGPSEEIVLPRIAEAHDVPVDLSFVSIVPLGGRHVNHFWRLLNGLDIPHVTLLDLDREREGGGWGRIKYVAKELLELGVPRDDILEIQNDDGISSVLSDEKLEGMHKWKLDEPEKLAGWSEAFEEHGVFFSEPLDLDFMMYQSFPSEYQNTAKGSRGPRIPKEEDDDREDEIKDAIKAVLKKKGSSGATYSDAEKLAFFWYRYLFLGRGKPTTHILALAEIEDDKLKSDCPEVLKRLAEAMRAKLGLSAPEEATEPASETPGHAEEAPDAERD